MMIAVGTKRSHAVFKNSRFDHIDRTAAFSLAPPHLSVADQGLKYLLPAFLLIFCCEEI